jgi:hypothetical protein
MSLIRAIKQQLGLSVTPNNNFCLDASADNGTMKLARGNAGATTQDIMTVDAAGKVSFPQGQNPVAGQVLQEVVGSQLLTNVASTNSTVISNTYSITPKSTNSKIIVEFLLPLATIAAAGAGTNNTGSINLAQTAPTASTISNAAIGVVSGAGTNVQTQGSMLCAAVLSNSELTTRSFQLAGNCSNAAGQFTPGQLVVSIREVQQ